MNIQESILPFNRMLVTIDHESFGASFELPIEQTNIVDACQHLIAKEVATQAHDLVNEGKMDLLEAARAGLSVVYQIEKEAEVCVYIPDSDKILEYTKALINSVSNKDWTALDDFEAKYGSLPEEVKEYLKILIK